MDVWFEGVGPNTQMPSEAILARWWGKGRSAEDNAKFNDHLREKFGSVLDTLADLPVAKHASQIAKELHSPSADVKSLETYNYSLGLLLLLDQMPRCILGASSPLVYKHYDLLAQSVSKDALDKGIDSWFNADSLAWRFWFYLPLEHSENLEQHERLGKFLKDFHVGREKSVYTDYVVKAGNDHHEIIKTFGRYPYRNAALGRSSSPQEEAWIREHGNPFSSA